MQRLFLKAPHVFEGCSGMLTLLSESTSDTYRLGTATESEIYLDSAMVFGYGVGIANHVDEL